VQLFARSAQLELLDFVRSMIEQRQLRDPMGGRARAGDKFMVEVDQFVIGLREPQFEKCGSYDSFGDRVYMKAYRHKLGERTRPCVPIRGLRGLTQIPPLNVAC